MRVLYLDERYESTKVMPIVSASCKFNGCLQVFTETMVYTFDCVEPLGHLEHLLKAGYADLRRAKLINKRALFD